MNMWKGKGSKLYLNMTRYKEWDAKFLEALEYKAKNCPLMLIGEMKGNSSSEHLIVKTWMKTN